MGGNRSTWKPNDANRLCRQHGDMMQRAMLSSGEEQRARRDYHVLLLGAFD